MNMNFEYFQMQKRCYKQLEWEVEIKKIYLSSFHLLFLSYDPSHSHYTLSENDMVYRGLSTNELHKRTHVFHLIFTL